MKNRTITKIVSCVLCTAISMQVGLALTDERVNADGRISYIPPAITFSTDELATCNWYITNGTSGYNVWSSDTGTSDNLQFSAITVGGGWAQVIIGGSNGEAAEVEASVKFDSSNNGRPYFQVNKGSTLKCTGISGDAYLFVVDQEGKLECDTFDMSTYSGSTNNYGTIVANDMIIETNEITCWDDATFEVSDSFTIGTGTLYGTVVAELDTVINSSGATFTLSAGGATKKITGVVSNKTAAELLDDPEVELASVPSVYCGQDYDFTPYISTAAGYGGEPYLEFKDSLTGSTYEIGHQPSSLSALGYRVRAVAPAYGTYYEDYSTWQSFSFNFLPLNELYPDGAPYVTVSNAVNDYYVKDDYLVLTVPEGIHIACPNSPTLGSDFYSSVTIPLSEIYYGSGIENINSDFAKFINQDYSIMFRVSDDDSTINGAATSPMSIKDVLVDADDLIFDFDDPYVGVEMVDDVEASIEDGILTGDVVTIGISDENLDKIYVNGELYEDYEEVEEGYIQLTINSTADTATDYTIKVTDLSGRESTLEFTLYPYQLDATIELSVPDPIYVDDDYEIGIKTNSNSDEISYQYDYRNINRVLEGKPTEAGEYVVEVKIAENEFYTEVSDTIDFDIIRRTPDVSVTVPKTYVGDEIAPVLTGVPEDYDEETIIYEYKLSTDEDSEYSETAPEAAGDYTLRVTLPRTRKYEKVTKTTAFTISKNAVTATVSVDDILIGGEIDPELTVDPEDYDGMDGIKYEYKLSTAADTAYSTTVPTAAGTYTVRVTLPETDTYAGKTCEDEFTISKYEIEEGSVTVTVKDIFVGDTVKPELSGIPEDYYGEITYMYKGSDDTEYTGDVPETAGTYTVLAKLSSTDKYLGTSCTSTFKISKNSVIATVSVADFYVGGKPNPVVTTVSDGDVTFEYKSADTAYSKTVPTAAGEYTVRATVAESDKYLGTSCTDTFTISKNAVTATVSADDIYVGGTPDPVVEIDPETYDGKYTVVYENEAGEKVTAFNTAGKYKATVTLPDTEAYKGTTCTDTFKVSKKAVTAKVSVEDIVAGGTVKPVLTVDPEDYDGKAQYEYKSSTDASYSSTVPTAAGEYTVRVTLPETDTYLGTTCSADFTINAEIINISATVSVADIYVGGTPNPVVKINPETYDGKYTVVYENEAGEKVTSFNTAGNYKATVTLPDTEAYKGTTCTDTFKVSKKTVTATVSVEDIVAGGTVEPVLTVDPEDYDGKVRYEYKGSADASYSSTVPTAAGTYKVRATLQETDVFEGTECEADFTISKGEVKATVTVADIYVGGTPAPSVKTDPADYDGTPVYEYKLSSDPDTAYSSAVPGTAGTYTVRATLPSTVNYLGTTCTDEFTISKNTVTAIVSVADITVGNTPAPVVKTESDGKVIFEYKSSSAPDTAYSSAVPSKAGKYTVRATVEETNRYLSTTCTAEFTISLNKVTKMDLSVPDIFYGQTVSASFDTDSDGAVTIVYKSSGAADSTYSSTAPVKVGSYIAMATVDETDKFESDSCTVAFKISYLDAPATAYTLSGTQGKNGYYTSDVVLNAPQGFSVSASEGGTFSGSIPYSENLNTIYLKRSDGALTAGIAISNKPKIDKAAPSISSSSGISNGAVLFESSVTLTVNDPNLALLKVNGSAVSLSSSESTVLTLTRPESGFKTFSITAEDEAGNISTFEFTLMAEWLKDKKIPAGQTVSLNAGEVYYLDEGTWIVSIVNSDGTITEGTTVFSGNLPFYVGVTGDYIFTRVT